MCKRGFKSTGHGNIPRLANQISHPSGGVVNCPTPGTLRSVKFSPLRARGLGGDVRISNWIGTFFRWTFHANWRLNISACCRGVDVFSNRLVYWRAAQCQILHLTRNGTHEPNAFLNVFVFFISGLRVGLYFLRNTLRFHSNHLVLPSGLTSLKLCLCLPKNLSTYRRTRWFSKTTLNTNRSFTNTWNPCESGESSGSCALGLLNTSTEPGLSTRNATTKARQWRWSGLATTCLGATPTRAGMETNVS